MSYYKYCQSEIESNGKCEQQCDHCKEYYEPLESKSVLSKNTP